MCLRYGALLVFTKITFVPMYGLFRRSRSVTSVLFVLVVYMEGDPEPNTMSDHTKAFLDVFQ